MDKTIHQKILNHKKKYNYYLIGFTITLICLGLSIYGLLTTSKDSSFTDLSYMIENEINQTVKVKLEANALYSFAYYEDNDIGEWYYIEGKDGYLYLGFVGKDEYESLNVNEDGTIPGGHTFKGGNYIIPDDIHALAIEVYNDNMEDNIITEDNFDNWFGTYCLDATIDPSVLKSYNNSKTIYIVLMSVTSLLSLMFIYLYITYTKNYKKTIDSIDQGQMNKINNELDDPNTKYYSKSKLYLSKNYLIDLKTKLVIIPYSEISWIYIHELKQNGITTQRNLVIYDKNKIRYDAVYVGSGTKQKEVLDEIYQTLQDNSKQSLFGYTEENKNKFKTL